MVNYLVKEDDRKDAIREDTNDMIEFQHQEIEEVYAFRSGLFENALDINPFGIPLYVNL